MRRLSIALLFLVLHGFESEPAGAASPPDPVSAHRLVPMLNLLLGADEGVGTGDPEADGPRPVDEVESNDVFDSPQSLGRLVPGQTVRVSGRIARGGVQAGWYAGDLDFYRLVLPDSADVTLELDWTGNANVDIGIFVEDVLLDGDVSARKPIRLAATLSPRTFTLLVASTDRAADYELVLSARRSSATYPNDNTLLSGKYYQPTVSLGGDLGWTIRYYQFDGADGWQYCAGSTVLGVSCTAFGRYEIWYPYLLLTHQESGCDPCFEYFELVFSTSDLIRLDGVRHERE